MTRGKGENLDFCRHPLTSLLPRGKGEIRSKFQTAMSIFLILFIFILQTSLTMSHSNSPSQ